MGTKLNMSQQCTFIASEVHVYKEEHVQWTEGSYSSPVCFGEVVPRIA